MGLNDKSEKIRQAHEWLMNPPTIDHMWAAAEFMHAEGITEIYRDYDGVIRWVQREQDDPQL